MYRSLKYASPHKNVIFPKLLNPHSVIQRFKTEMQLEGNTKKPQGFKSI